MEAREFPWGAEKTVDHQGKGSPRGTWAHVALTDEACPGSGEIDADVIPLEGGRGSVYSPRFCPVAGT